MIDLELEGGGAASEAALAALESRFGPLPEDYKAFLKANDGAEPNADHVVHYDLDGEKGAGGVAIRRFEKAEDIPATVDQIEGWDASYLPFAFDSSGNYFCFHLKTQEACVWDHDINAYIKVADGFSGFLDVIEAFDLDEFLKSRRQDQSL